MIGQTRAAVAAVQSRNDRRLRRALQLSCVALALALLLAIVLADAIWRLSGWHRGGALAAAALVVVGVAMTRRHRPDTAEATAIELERRSRREDNAIINGVQLEREARRPLIDRAIEAAVRAAGESPRDDPAATRRLRRAATLVLAGLLIWLAAWAWHPGRIGTHLLRVLHPWGDHPPWSAIGFDLNWQPRSPVVGGDVRVELQLAGPAPAQANLVIRHDDGSMMRFPMQRTGEASYWRQLVAVRQPLTLWAEAGDGRSRRQRIEPSAAAADVAEPAESTTPSHEADEVDAVSPGDLEALAAQIEALAGALRQLAAAFAGDASPQALQSMMAEALADAEAARAAIASLAAEAPAGWQASLARLDEALAAWTAAMRNAARGGEPSQLADAARAAAEALGRGVADLQSGRASSGPSEPAPEDEPPALAGGDSFEVIASRSDAPVEIEVVTGQAPRAYRQLVASYFRRLAEDDRR